jgi:transposase
MPRRHELTDEEWALVEPLMPRPSAGRPWSDHRRVVSGALYWAATGVPWRDLPERFGPWQTVHERFTRWREDGTLLRILRCLRGAADREGLIDWSLFCVDSTMVRASRAAAGATKKNRGVSRRTTRSAAAAAGSGPSSTWSATATGCRSGRR